MDGGAPCRHSSKLERSTVDGDLYMLFDKSQNGVPDYESRGTKGSYAPARGQYLELGNHEVLLALTGPRGALNDEALAVEDADQTLRLALTESQADLPIDRAMLRLAAMEFVIRNAAPTTGGKSSARSAGIPECPLREDDFDAKPADPCVFRRGSRYRLDDGFRRPSPAVTDSSVCLGSN